MLQSLFAVGIVFLCIVTNITGVQSRVYFTNKKYEWFKAKNQCTLLRNKRSIAHSHLPTGLGWTNYAAKYLPWVEYLGCFRFRSVTRLYSLTKQVTEGEQLQECIVHCNGSLFFGLQKSTCICLNNPNREDLHAYIVNSCDTYVALCSGDPFAFCGTESDREYISVYKKVIINSNHRYKNYNTGNCLAFKRRTNKFIEKSCSTKLHPICYNDGENILEIVNKQENWTDAFNNCLSNKLASYTTVVGRRIPSYVTVWLSNTRRWQRINEYTVRPYYCVAAKINQNGVVETILRKCRDKLPGLCTGNLKASSGASTVTSSSLSQNTKNRRTHTSPFLQSSTLPGPTRAAFPHLPKSTIVAVVESTTSLDLQETTLEGTLGTLFPGFQKTASLGFQETKSPEFHETTSPGCQEITFPLESSSSSVPVSDGIDAILILAIIAAVSLTIIIIIVTVVFCKRKRTTQFTVSDQPMANIGKEVTVVYAQVNKPTVKREKSTSSQKSQPAASDDTYDHMDHRRVSQTHNPTESNYDTMRSIANAGEEENNYDHVTGTKMEPKRFVVDNASNYSHVEVEFHEVKDI